MRHGSIPDQKSQITLHACFKYSMCGRSVCDINSEISLIAHSDYGNHECSLLLLTQNIQNPGFFILLKFFIIYMSYNYPFIS